MPREITIYWDAKGKIPEVIDTLESPMREEVLHIIKLRKNELQRIDVMPLILGLLVLMIIFVIAGLKSRPSRTKENTA